MYYGPALRCHLNTPIPFVAKVQHGVLDYRLCLGETIGLAHTLLHTLACSLVIAGLN